MDSILNINLSAARGKDEDFNEYKDRLKTNKRILKLYRTYGREAFQAMFPNGVSEALENSEAQRQFHHENNPEIVDNTNKTTYQSKVNKSQNVSSKAPTQMRKSGRGK